MEGGVVLMSPCEIRYTELIVHSQGKHYGFCLQSDIGTGQGNPSRATTSPLLPVTRELITLGGGAVV